MLNSIQTHFGWKIFFSYVVIILVGILVLGVSVELAIPTAFDQHMMNTENMMGDQMMGEIMSGQNMELELDLFTSFRSAINLALFRAAASALIIALIVSVLVSYRVVSPVREMMVASQYIAEGHYQERVHVPGDPSRADELSQLAISFNRMAEILDQNETVRQRLIGDISHELRTPLTVIKGSLEGLIDNVLPSDPETYQKIYQEAERMTNLVEDLQLLSRVESGSYQMNKAPAIVQELIETAVDRLYQQFEDKEVVLQTDFPSELPEVFVDSERIGQILLNIVGNALQHTPAGGEVKISAVLSGEEVHVLVRDTGIGVPLEHQPHLFTRFYRVDKSRSRASGGSGIGLTIAKHFIEAQDGRIWMESGGRGKGSIFTFSLPILE
jgi:two-component system sensor histidine kinase BaeS